MDFFLVCHLRNFSMRMRKTNFTDVFFFSSFEVTVIIRLMFDVNSFFPSFVVVGLGTCEGVMVMTGTMAEVSLVIMNDIMSEKEHITTEV